MIKLTTIAWSYRFWIYWFWYNTIFFKEWYDHIPLSTILLRGIQKEFNLTTTNFLICCSNNLFQEPVWFFIFIPEKCVGLRKLETFQFKVWNQFMAESIKGRKHPATTWSFLVRHLIFSQINWENKIIFHFWLTCLDRFKQAVMGYCIFNSAILGIGLIICK